MMHHITAIAVVGLLMSPIGVAAQDRQAESRNVTQVVLGMVAAVERPITGIATEMPADKYSFAPTEGAFRGVRNFAAQIKHAAAVLHLVAATLLNERVTADMSDERGPDSVKTKEEVLKYLNESFAALRRAAATVNEENVFEPFKGPFSSRTTTRLELIVLAVAHTSNHYGQVVEYLRMNGLVPPRTQ